MVARATQQASTTMPPLAAADAFRVLEFVAGNRRVPHSLFAGLLAALPPVSPQIGRASCRERVSR